MSTAIEQTEATEASPPAPRVKPRVYRNPRATLTPEQWIIMAKANAERIAERIGILDDSALLVAEDRRRDD